MDDAAPAIPEPSTDELARRFREWADVDGPGYAPMYMGLAYAAAADPTTLEILAQARPGQRRPVMFFAAVHDLLLRGVEHELVGWYPDLVGHARHDDPGPTLLDFCRQHRDALVEIVSRRRVQTNEVGRAAALLPALRVAQGATGGPVALVEVGASAGLNLLFDRFGYRYASRSGPDVLSGDARSPVQLRTALVGHLVPPAAGRMPEVAARVGVDVEPVDVTDTDAARWLRACVFAEQIERRARLDAALDLAAPDPPEVVAGDAAEILPAVVASLPEELAVCLWHSWTFTYSPATAATRSSTPCARSAGSVPSCGSRSRRPVPPRGSTRPISNQRCRFPDSRPPSSGWCGCAAAIQRGGRSRGRTRT